MLLQARIAKPPSCVRFFEVDQFGCDSKRGTPELAGYADYAAKVRYQLIPGVW